MREFMNLFENVSPANQAMGEIETIDGSNGSQVSCSNTGYAEITIDRIVVDDASRGQGHGSALLKQVTDIADQFGVTLELEPASTGEMDSEELAYWYQRNGFKVDDTKSSMAGATIMVRRPRKARG